MHPHITRLRGGALIVLLTTTIVLSACSSKPESSDIRKLLPPSLCSFVIKDVNKTNGMEGPNKQYEVAYTVDVEFKGGKQAAADFLSKYVSLQAELKDAYAQRDREGFDSVAANDRLGSIRRRSKELVGYCEDTEGLKLHARIFELASEIWDGPIPIPYAFQLSGDGTMKKAESGWIFTRIGVLGIVKRIESEPINIALPKPPASATPARTGEAPTGSPTGELAATNARAGDVTPVVPQGPAQATAPTGNTPEAKIVAEATDGKFKATKGKYFDSTCNESLDYEAKVVDLNGDGQPEVFTSVDGTCLGGMAGVYMDLFIKDTSGRWKPQFGFPGIYTVLKTNSQGYPDIEVGGPGNCSPVWRWTGQQYAIYKKCP